MAGRKRKTDSKYITQDGHSYLTKRVVISKAQAAGKEAAAQAMDIMGYVIVAEGSHIVKKYANGNKETIASID